MKNSRIVLFVDDNPTPIASFMAPVKFELDTTKLVDGINAYGKGDSNEFYISGSETPQSIPAWVWILLIGFVGWAAFYLLTYINVVPN